MKKLFTILCLCLAFVQAQAQEAFDTIVKNDKVEIKAKIEELTETTIKYKKFEMLDGPTYNINLSEVFMIIYKNGTKEYIKVKETSQPVVQNTSPVAAPATQNVASNGGNQTKNIDGGHVPMVKIRKGYYSFEGYPLKSHSDYVTTFEKYGYKDLAARVKEGKTFQFAGSGLGFTCLIVGLATGQMLLVVLGGVGALILGSSGVSARENAVQEFNRRATKKLAFNGNGSFSIDAPTSIAIGN